jgi:hypothetical protein
VELDDGTFGQVPVFKLTGGTTITLDDALGPQKTGTAKDIAKQSWKKRWRPVEYATTR